METLAVIESQPADAGAHPPPPTTTKNRADISRRNGQQSRGPATHAGKERSRCNAVTHGLFARVVPQGLLPVFADRREYASLAAQMQAEFGVRTTMGKALVESLALDLLRLRQIRSMEVAIFDPGLDADRDLEQALRTRERANRRRTQEDNEAIHQAYRLATTQVRAGNKISVPMNLAPTLVYELWHVMTSARGCLERDQHELKELDERIAAADPAEATELQSQRPAIVEAIAQDEIDMKSTDRELFLIERESQLACFIYGRRRIPPAMRARWVELLEQQQRSLEYDMAEVRNADVGIHLFRRRHLLAAVNRIEDLNRLSEYEDRRTRSIAKTVALIKQVEAGAVDDEPTP